MSFLRLRSWVAVAALAAAAGIGACSKTGSPPGGFGVNITVDASGVSAANRAKIKSATLKALSDKAGATVVSSTIDKFPDAVQGGTVRFHYTPAGSVKKGERLTIGIDALGAGGVVIASGSDQSPPLGEHAVDLTITLEGTGDAGAGPTDSGEEVAPGKKALGTACVVNDDCNSGICADQVCCDTECKDVCASCNQPTTKGTCTAYAVNTDPEMECSFKAPPVQTEEDAGSAPATDGATGGDAAASDAAAAKPAGDASAAEVAESDAAVIYQPDGGFMSMPSACGGTCSGTKSCKYPGKTTSCGKAFCNTRREVGTFVCDGTGGCSIDLSACDMYSCAEEKGACNTLCAGPDDCLLAYYCATDGHCLPRKVLGGLCTTDGECKSDHCAKAAGAAQGVCCNTACTGTGLSCNDPGQAGQCKCQGVNCAAGVACQIFYQDADNDTFGNLNGSLTVNPPTAKAGCMGMTPPPGFVADNTDCDDTDANAHPGQTMFFSVQRNGGGFDFDCDLKTTKETPEYPGGSCKFCGAVGTCDQTKTTCTTANQTASYICPQEIAIFTKFDLPVDFSPDLGPRTPLLPPGTGLAAAAPAAAPGEVLPPPIILPPKLPQCCGCAANDKTGFLQAVACGDGTKYVYTCGACSVAGGAAAAQTKALKQQRCR